MKIQIDYVRTSVGTLQQCDVRGIEPQDARYQKALGMLGQHLNLSRGKDGRLDTAGTLELDL